MKFLGLIWRSAWRKKIRTALTVLSVLVAFVLFTLLSAVGRAFDAGGAMTGAERLVVIDKVSLINFLPISYEARIARIPGVATVTHQSWFGGYYQDPKNQFPQFPVEPEDYFDVYPELVLPEEQMRAWKEDRTGAVVGKDLAETYGFKIGDRVPIQSTIFSQKNGSRTWEFDIVGIVDTTDPKGGSTFLLFRHDYFAEANSFGDGFVGWFTLRLEPGADPVEVSDAIDMEFANSPNETETSTEAAFAASFAKQFGNIALIVTLILAAVFFTLLLVTGNTMAQSVRERIAEIAVMKTVGFSDGKVLAIVLSESVLIMLLGGLLGLGVGWILCKGVAAALASFMPGIIVSAEIVLTAVAFMVIVGLVAGLFPALHAMRLSIVDALARG
jgi:putative ABC transport system permease protein